MRYLIIITCVIVISIAGCSSTAVRTNSNDKAIGLPYYLPKGMVNLEIMKEKVEGTLAIKITEVKIQPDNAFRYTLQYQPNSMSDDGLEVTTTKTGLLSELKFTSDEHTDEFIIKLAEAIKEGAKAAFTPFGIVQEGKEYNLIYVASFDPFTELNEINAVIQKLNPRFEIQFPVLNSPVKFESAKRSDCDQNNICFRPTSVFPLILKENGVELQRINMELPDPTVMGQIDVTRAVFVRKVTNLTFDNGSLVKVEINKPSEAIAGIEIPINILRTFASIPAEIIQLKINHSTNNKGFSDALKDELDSRQALKDAINKTGDPISESK